MYTGQPSSVKWGVNKIVLVCIAGLVVMFWQKIYNALFSRTAAEIQQETVNQAQNNQVQNYVDNLKKMVAEQWLYPNYYRKFVGAHIFNQAYTNQLVVTLRAAMDGIGTDESAIYNVFQSCRYKSQASWLAANYASKYNSSLMSDLSDEMDEIELGKIATILLKLPDA